MGLLSFLKNSYESEYNLENLEDLVYEDELQKPPVVRKKQDRQDRDDEEKYDHLLNSVQAQNLIKTVDKLKDEKTVERSSLPNVDRKPKNLERVDTKNFKTSDMTLYVKSQCDIMEEASLHIEKAKAEYEHVTESFNDITLLETAPKDILDKIKEAAEKVDSLSVDRRMTRNYENSLSNSAYHRMELFEGEMPEALRLLRRQEEYYQAVVHDMRMLDGERLSHKMESVNLVKRQLLIKRISQLAIICLAFVFAIILITLVASGSDENANSFIVVFFLAAVLAISLAAILKATQRQVYVTENKLNKATVLLNKVKIKYINAANTLDYTYNKFDVDSSYELEQKYKAYLDMKVEQQKLMKMTTSLNEAEQELQGLLKQLGLFEPHIWLGQVKALLNPREMVEIRHALNVRRQKLRSQIEYNEGRINEAKQNIKSITSNNPKYAGEALRVVEMYERKHN